MRYGIIGCGAVGGYYGGLLQNAGCDVHFLVHGDYAHVRRHGLVIESPRGNVTLPRVNAYPAADRMPRCDVAVVALKSTANAMLAEALPAMLGPRGLVLLLQNGMGEEERIAAIPGVRSIVAGLCFLCSNKTGPGHIRHIDYGQIALGHFSPRGEALGETDDMRALAADLARAGIEIRLEPDLATARWRKLVWNIPYNGLTVVMNTTTDRLMRDADTRALIDNLMTEVAAAGSLVARPIGRDFIDLMLSMTDAMPPYNPSMKIDYDSGRPMELAAIYGAPIRRAGQAGFDMALTRMLYRQLLFLERATPGNRAPQ